MSTLTWVLLGVGVYWLALATLRARGLLPSSVGARGPVVTIQTKRGQAFLNWLARPRRFWRAWSNFGLGAALVVMLGWFLLLVAQAGLVLRNPPAPTAANRPQNVLVIPGINEFLPLSVAPEIVFGLLVGTLVHEIGHGLLCRVEDIEVRSMGVALVTILPVAAFVEPDEESRRRADRGGQSRMFAAGVTNNFALTLVAFILLFGPVVGSLAVAPGAAVGGVLPGSAAADAGVERGDRIVAVEGRAVDANDDLGAVLSSVDARSVSVALADGEETTITRSLLVTGVVDGSPLADGLGVNATVAAVNGTAVHTEAGFIAALQDREVATVTTADATNVTAPMGAFVRVVPDGPAAAGGMPAGETVVVTRIDGTRTATSAALSEALASTRPGQEVTVRAYDDGTAASYTVTLGENPNGDQGFLGVGPLYNGVSGVTVNDFGTRLYPAGTYLAAIGMGGSDGPVRGFFGAVTRSIVLPFASLVVPGLEFNFAGFVGWNAGFYEVDGPLSVLGGWLFVLANVLFWTGWINLNLAFVNCIPAFPLDGGHLLRMTAEAVVSRLPVERGRNAVRAVTTSVGLLMLASLMLVLFGPQLLR